MIEALPENRLHPLDEADILLEQGRHAEALVFYNRALYSVVKDGKVVVPDFVDEYVLMKMSWCSREVGFRDKADQFSRAARVEFNRRFPKGPTKEEIADFRIMTYRMRLGYIKPSEFSTSITITGLDEPGNVDEIWPENHQIIVKPRPKLPDKPITEGWQTKDIERMEIWSEVLDEPLRVPLVRREELMSVWANYTTPEEQLANPLLRMEAIDKPDPRAIFENHSWSDGYIPRYFHHTGAPVWAAANGKISTHEDLDSWPTDEITVKNILDLGSNENLEHRADERANGAGQIVSPADSMQDARPNGSDTNPQKFNVIRAIAALLVHAD